MIHGVKITPLKQFLDERGKVMHMLRSDAKHFEQFGEIYFSCIYPNVVKAWHIHKTTTLNYAVPIGNIKFVLYDDREGSPTKGVIQEIFMGPDSYCLVSVPPLIWNGFKGIGTQTALVANCATRAYDPNEVERKSPFDPYFPYNWDIQHK